MPESLTRPSVAVIIPVMDRADELRTTLPLLLAQDYANFCVCLVDCGSQDHLSEVLTCFHDERLRVLGIPRPSYFSFSRSRNVGARFSDGDLLLFLNGDNILRNASCLRLMVDGFLSDPRVDREWFAAWRRQYHFEAVSAASPAAIQARFRRVFSHAQGSILLVERATFQALGGFNELLEDWGYEDTDLVARLELSGFGRLEAQGVRVLAQPNEDELRTRNFRVKDTELTWTRNRLLSDYMIRRWGTALAIETQPAKLDEVRSTPDGQEAPHEQEWSVEYQLSDADIEGVKRLSRLLSGEATPGDGLPKVSVVVPCKDRAGYLRATLDSILSQTYPNLDCIVVDGGSSDGTLEILADYGDRIRWLSRPDNGAFDAINEGWSMSDGEILAWLNADDVWEPHAVERAVAHFLAYPEADVVYGHCGGIDEGGRLVDVYPARPWSLPHAALNCDHVINQAASFMRRRILERVGWLYPAWCHDHDLWLRIALAGGVFQIADVQLASARIWGGNLGNVAEIVIPAKIGLTERFFSTPELPRDLSLLRRRAMSNAYLRAYSYVPLSGERDIRLALSLLGRALRLDSHNAGHIAAIVLRESFRRVTGVTPLRQIRRILSFRRIGRPAWL